MTTDQPDRGNASEPSGSHMRPTYVGVVIVEVIVLLALWVFSRLFRG
jgi:hypothetical protein